MDLNDFSFADLRTIAIRRESLGRLLSLIQVEYGLEELETWFEGFRDISNEYGQEYLNTEEMLADLEYEFGEHFKIIAFGAMGDGEVNMAMRELRV